MFFEENIFIFIFMAFFNFLTKNQKSSFNYGQISIKFGVKVLMMIMNDFSSINIQNFLIFTKFQKILTCENFEVHKPNTKTISKYL